MKATTRYVLNILIFVQIGLHISDGACTFPTNLQSGTWHSSDMGDVTFNSTHFTVSKIVDFGSHTFECVSKTSGRYYSESESFNYLGIANPFKLSLCLKLVQLSSTKYIYYPMTSVLANTDINRVYFNQVSHTFSASETCDDQSLAMDHVRLLVKSGYANVSSVDCINAISGVYTYNVTGSTCSSTSLDVCTDRNEMVFNYTYCSDIMAYSAGGQLTCMYNRYESGRSYTLLYNQDATTDETTYYRFTCLVSKEASDGTYVTTFPMACMTNQNTTAINTPGVAFVLSANTTCKTDEEDATTTLSAGAAVAVVIALLILIVAAVVVGIWYYIKVHKNKKVNPDMIAAKSPPLDTKERNLDGRVSPFSPYPTVSELALGRFGPSEIDDDDGGMTLEATTPGFTDGRRTMYGKDAERESQASLPMYSEVGGDTPEPTRLSEVHTRMSEISEVNIADPTPFTMTRATMNIPEETRVSPLQTPSESRPNGAVQSPRENGEVNDVTL